MKAIRILLFAVLTLWFCSCSKLPDFSVRVVDADSGAPIGGAGVDLKTTRPKKWVPDYIESSRYLGKTDEQGIFGVEELVQNSSHRLTIYKPGFKNRYVFVKNGGDGGATYFISGGGNKIGLRPLPESMPVEVRMTPGRETTKRTPYFAPTSGAWWEDPEGE